jgi:hypothetical protein
MAQIVVLFHHSSESIFIVGSPNHTIMKKEDFNYMVKLVTLHCCRKLCNSVLVRSDFDLLNTEDVPFMGREVREVFFCKA